MLSKEICVPDFTVEDYATEAPFEWLYQHRANKFLLKQLTAKMKAQAGALGVKGFIGLFNAYCESMSDQRSNGTERVTEFDGQPLELLCGEYICNNSGVSVLDKFGFEEMICPHPIEPVRRLVNVDSGEERLELAYKKGQFWRQIIVEKSVIASSQKILELAGLGVIVNSENAKALSTYLFRMEQMNYETIPEKKSAGRLGWIGDHGFSPYMDGLEFDGEDNFSGIFSSIKQAGDREKWIETIKSVRAEKALARFAIAASFASVLLEPCGLLPFFVHFKGGQGVGKTVAVMLAASVWARPRMGDYATSFNSTAVGMEMLAGFLNSMPICMDELQIQSAKGVRDYDSLIYQMTERAGRLRGAKAGGIRKVEKWNNCILTTGEDPIIQSNSMGGASVRVIEIDCPGPIYSDMVGLCRVINDNYGWAGREFVQYIQQDGMMEKVIEIQTGYYNQLLEYGETKQAASASTMLTADQIATELFFKDGNALTVDEIAEFMTKKEDVDVNRRALEYVYELVARNPSHFDTESNKTELWGKVDDADGYISIVKSVFDREMGLGGFNSTSFLSWAKRQDLLKTDPVGADGKSRNTKKQRINGTSVNTVCIRNRVEDDKDNGEQSGEFDLPF